MSILAGCVTLNGTGKTITPTGAASLGGSGLSCGVPTVTSTEEAGCL
jgi:hypothetical protein